MFPAEAPTCTQAQDEKLGLFTTAPAASQVAGAAGCAQSGGLVQRAEPTCRGVIGLGGHGGPGDRAGIGLHLNWTLGLNGPAEPYPIPGCGVLAYTRKLCTVQKHLFELESGSR